ncbi:MAG TPA: tRNA lysidine(34) synthetase TilS [Ktedonobacteraceae bacterium]|nr:tRNA lysidine(34) synthetase TilS [Ktedonobacteraceae bacterium]
MLEKVRAFIDRYQLLPAAGEIVVGVSGGADSLCLLHLLRRLCGPGLAYPGVTLRAAHLNHQLRGEESAEDARVVARLAEQWGIPFTGGSTDVAALASAEKRSLEDAARQARYAFLRGVAGGRRIAVAHHADDQVETLLLHWLRGSGLSGLVGMPPRQQDIIRPLLEVTRAETRAYCAEHHITPLEDLSNSDPRFLRNRLRHDVLPRLQAINPGLRQTLLRNADVLRVDLDWLETQVDSHWQSVVIAEQDTEIRLDIHALLRLPLSLQRHLLRRASAHICAGQSPLEPRHQLAIEQQLCLAASSLRERELHLPRRLQAHFQAGELILRRQTSGAPGVSLSAWTGEVELPIPGEALLPGTPWQVKVEIIQDEGNELQEALRQENWARLWRLLEPPTPHAVYIDGAAAGQRLHVRTRRPGDRIQPLGMHAEKKVQDIFVDAHIGRAVRATTPLFFSDTACLWVAGSCLSHTARLTSQTRHILRLSITYIQPAEP